MKRLIQCLIFSLPLVALVGCGSPTSTGGIDIENIIAHYPLSSTPNDTLGKQAPMVLQNTQFQDGGIYCAGTYNTHHAMTPTLGSLDFNSFTISAWFKVKEITALPSQGRPVFVGGNMYRWMGLFLRPDTTISLLYNNSSYVHTDTRFKVNVWHIASISYDSTTQLGKLYLDGRMIASATFPLNHGNNKNVGTTNFANGTAFLGILRDLKIYNATAPSLSMVND